MSLSPGRECFREVGLVRSVRCCGMRTDPPSVSDTDSFEESRSDETEPGLD